MEAMDSARSSASGDGIDRRLREALSPAPQAVERIVRRALDPEARDVAGPGRLLLPASLGAVLAIALALAVAIPRRPAEARVSISNIGGVVVATSAREGWIVQSGGRRSPNPDVKILIVYGGDR